MADQNVLEWGSLLMAIDEALPQGMLPGERALIAAAPDLLAALRDLVDATTDAYKAGRIAAEPFVRARNVIAQAGA